MQTTKRLKAVLALLVAMMFAFQTAPMLSFAEQPVSDTEAGAETSAAQDAEAADDEETLNFAVDSEGNQVELADGSSDAEYDTVATPEPQSDGFYEADTDAFFEYDESDVTLAAERVAATYDFESANVGDTSADGWYITAFSSGGYNNTSTYEVVESDRGKALRLTKNQNGAMNGDASNAGDESLFATHDFETPMSGVIAVTADIYVDHPGRMGLFVYGKTDDIASDLRGTSFPYLGRGYLWDSGATDKAVANNSPQGLSTWDNMERTQYKDDVNYEVAQWYTMRADIDTENATYDYTLLDADGSTVYSQTGLSLHLENLAASDGLVYGAGITVMGDVKSLGTVTVKNITLIDNNLAAQDAEDVAADRTALSLPEGFDANNVTEGFTVPISGQNGSTITWTSSDSRYVRVDNTTGQVTVVRPEFTGAGSINVSLTAHLEKWTASADKMFTLRVLENAPGTDREKAEGDAALLELPEGLRTTSVEENFTLQTATTYGSTITYTSSNDSIISVDNATGLATVTKPPFSGSGTQPVTITAAVKYGSATVTKTFDLQVVEQDPVSDAEKAIYDANNALIGGIDINNVRQESFYLGETGTYGTLSWSSSDENYIAITKNADTIITDEGDEDGSGTETEVQSDGYKATVTRPDRNASSVQVTITVTANVNGQTATKDFVLTVVPEDALKAYPGVEGYGAYTTGGRGGKVYHVTTLAHDGEGSLTYGLEQVAGARTIVFDVGGVIDLTPLGRPISIRGERYANVTIAGQTAPYPGITLKGYGITMNSTHDVIMRNIKIRIGDVQPDNHYYQSDPMSIGNSRNVVVDHCTMQWAIDMDFRATGEYITISNTIFGKSLLENSPHEKGGHAYVGMINEGARKVTFAKNFIGDSTQRSPRITDADWVDSYNCLLYNCGNGYDLFNYEWQDKNAKMNVYNNYARKGPSLSNATPYRAGRGRDYSGGVFAYFEGNYVRNASDGLQESATNNGKIKYMLQFGTDNGYGADSPYNLSNVTLDEWSTNPASYDNDGKTSGSAATFTYMTYPFPAPRGEALEVFENGNTSGTNNIVNYASDDNGMGATRPARDLYDTMIMEEMLTGNHSRASLDEDEVAPFFEELEKRTGRDYSEFKTERDWKIQQGAGPVLKGAESEAGETKPVDWDNYTDTNVNNPNYNAADKYDSDHTTNFEVGDWWGEYCGSPGQETAYTLYDNVLNRTYTTTDPNYDQTRYTLISQEQQYIPTYRTVSDLVPADWVREGYPEIADFMDSYREAHYPGMTDENDPRYNPSYQIAWDGMGDGIPNWYKEYRGWNTSQHLASTVNPDTGYTYLEEYIQFMADDQPLNVDNTPASIENFKVNNLGYSTAQVFWNTDYRTTCVLEYGTEPGVYTNSETLVYDETTDYYHTYHAQTLVDLQPDTQYYYKVTAIDENSNVTVAEYDANDPQARAMTFRTTIAPAGAADILPDKPVITNQVPYLNQVRINWTGNVATDESYEIYYDTTNYGTDYTQYSNRLTGIDARTNKQVVTGLTNNQTYYFLVVAVNQNGRTASDVISAVPSGVLFDFDFTQMNEEEQERYMQDEFMYVLGGNVSMEKDPDTGENVLQMLDETNSHGVNADNKLAVTQDETFTYEVKMKVLYQKQTDALNRQNYVDGDGAPQHNTVQLNFFKDVLPSEDMDSTNSALWETAFTIYFESESRPISESNGRYDGTVETNSLLFNSTPMTSYVSGTTPGSDADVERVLPTGTGYSLNTYRYTTRYGDAVYSDVADTDKTLHGLWYYQLGSADFVTYRVVVDPAQNNVKVYADGEPIYEAGEFSEDMEEPYNIGKVQIKSRNDGYSWVNVASIRAYSGDGTSTNVTPPAPVGPGTIGSTGGGSSPGGDTITTATATPAPSGDPAQTAEPAATEEPAATTDPEMNKYFTDLENVSWAVKSINKLAELGIVQGTSEGIFSPELNVTRAEYITMLMRGFGSEVQGVEVPFSDVDAAEWYYEPISKAYALEIANGYSDDNGVYFGINDNITREDMMVMAYRTLLAFDIEVPAKKSYVAFSDQSSISDYAVEAVDKMYCAEIINGVGDNMLDPKGVADRAQSAKVIYGLIDMEGTVNE